MIVLFIALVEIYINKVLQSDGTTTDMWSEQNNLPIHNGQSTCMTLGTRQKINKAVRFSIMIDNVRINPVSPQSF